jgi:hypothetical protein
MRPTSPGGHGGHHDPHAPSSRHAAAPRDEELHNDDVAHEHSDVNIRAIVASAAVIAAVCLVTAGLMYGLMAVLEDQARKRDPQLSPLAIPATNMPRTTTESPAFGNAPEPRLLTNEPGNLQQIRAREQEQLHTYGWVNEKAGVARIPVDEAKKLLLERGLPIRPDAVEDPRLGTRVPAYGESSSGRTITRPPATEPARVAPPEPPARKGVH